ncbi:MAG: GlsB/YeaQ/YmgE family stress response membrane protein [Bacteroidota bacterium]
MIVDLIVYILIGAAAGWAGGQLMKGRGFGFLGNVVIGIVGGFLGGALLRVFNVQIVGGNIAYFLTALVGAVALLFIASFFKGK